MPKIFSLLFSFFFFFILISNVLASGFQITRIGNLEVTGSLLSDWWYTGTNPTLSGIALANTTVNITVDGVSNSVNSDSDGQWSYTPSNLDSGDHEVLLTSSGSTISFTLHSGQALPENVGGMGGGESSQPVAGVSLPTVILLIGGIVLFLTGLRLVKTKSSL